MKRDDWMLLSLTFLTGVAIGMYVYVAVFKPTYAPENLGASEREAGEWSLVGKRRLDNDHGGAVQPSFRLLGDGSYVYLPGGSGDDDALEPREGRISRSLVREIRSYDNQLAAYGTDASSARCGADGFDYEYRVTVANTVYLLDTCYTALGQGTPLSELLASVWDQMEGGRRSYDSVSDWLQDWINRNIGANRRE